ncbi:acyl-CoA dehydrogenase family protein [Actinomadura sp. 6K520]|uniref:acyl-CoA dehydrogenase family protein n=1 Tax=Actinomadura sp. 6K520 TaxID=2530364 RepID=UPI00104CDC82|nr:acyl-CoA dehydrogenase family protein [Actinomadura sp. 6K520]TDE39233.1 acyl-CoA dehydrogenase [Actinomadura sp. 6K520]
MQSEDRLGDDGGTDAGRPDVGRTDVGRPVLPPTVEDERLRALRARVRSFVRHELETGGFTPAVDSWMSAWDIGFTRRLAGQGWLGMTIPVEYGGHGRTFLERFVVTEELLAAGAPVTAHWFADRQVAPSLLRFGTEEQKREFLPGIARGEVLFAIGMSEPESGSDLASVGTRAVRTEGGWTVTGTKVWTTNAHRADHMIALARTAPVDAGDRHAGLSQFIVDLRSPGVEIRPIVSMDGGHHFNEVFLGDVFVPDGRVLGAIGDGWHQVTSELGFERSGPERFLSTYLLLEDLTEAMRRGQLPADPRLGRFVARIAGLHRMSLAVAGALERGERADVAAAVVKALGTRTEGDVAEYAAMFLGGADVPASVRDAAGAALLARPGFTIRGGTNEILHGVIARGLGLR